MKQNKRELREEKVRMNEKREDEGKKIVKPEGTWRQEKERGKKELAACNCCKRK